MIKLHSRILPTVLFHPGLLHPRLLSTGLLYPVYLHHRILHPVSIIWDTVSEINLAKKQAILQSFIRQANNSSIGCQTREPFFHHAVKQANSSSNSFLMIPLRPQYLQNSCSKTWIQDHELFGHTSSLFVSDYQPFRLIGRRSWSKPL